MRATIKDVAREAGVSDSTVSYVLQRKGQPRTDVQRRVLEAVARLKYSPSPTARSLVQRRTNAISVVNVHASPDGFHDPHFAEEMSTISEVLGQSGYWLNLFLPGYQDDMLRTFLRDAEMDGLIWTRQDIPELLPEFMESRGIPYVQIEHNRGNFAPSASAFRIVIDYMGALETAMQYLLSLGHERIALMRFAAPDEEHPRKRSTRFEEAYEQFMQAHGLPYRCILNGGYTVRGGAAAFQEAVRTLPREQWPTAVVAASDPMAAGVIGAALELGIRVPEQLSVIGFDDSLTRQQMSIRLSSMAYPFHASIEDAVRYLDESIRSGEIAPPPPKTYAMQLVVRDSTGPVGGK